ncbi:MAG TPA: thiamine phosphate synthase, partial [Bryobacteraceae bacterium]|nr:thiamine phosphate synthase [Bryobacteraceae bacterium]
CEPLSAAEAITGAGARILQFRHKAFFGRETYELAERVASICARRGVLFVINDRADFAKLLGAAVHVGQHDLPPADARALLGAAAVIGFSTHNEVQLRAAAQEPADYVAFGPVYATASKSDPDPVTGAAELARLRPLSLRPVVAIGGITRENARPVLAAGADSVAVIRDLYPPDGCEASIARRAEDWLRLVNEN